MIKLTRPDDTTLDTAIASFMNTIKENEEFKINFEYIKSKQEEIEKFIQIGKTEKLNPENQLIVLRKWNSYTPVLPPKNDEYINKGGGYFIRIGLVGIVIDPGFNFIENFLRAGFKLDDIDHIFISHAHNDHTTELEGIFALLFKRNRNAKEHGNGYHKIKLYMNLGSFKKFAGYFDLSKPDPNSYIDDIVLLNKHQMIKISNDIEVFTTKAQHHEMITCDYALGFIFKFNSPNGDYRTVKFTCDTGWNESIEKENRQACESFLIDKTNILVAHNGSIKEKELNYDTSKKLSENIENLYDNHLGLIGTFAMIHYYKPEIALISEFGEEMNAIRHYIAETIRAFINKDVFAIDLNFRIDIDTLEIMCFKDRRYYNPKEIKTLYDQKHQLYYINPANLNPTEKMEPQNHLGKGIKVFPTIE
ncbi:MBL fold metallo-hydrolase [Geosporobacter ferrireducens]|uniref:MBL fold metallo-hydrolase n=1 Tax=Geosporobacter ferrireducens TaxID=1424294 RepID=UPI00139B5992|nr:MBL fold metallo-hydrolase [Geosporobacter ferrireducens]MTI53742.1 MBL fold metallo-hydrolase [Geosporobacter ferrireducens]